MFSTPYLEQSILFIEKEGNQFNKTGHLVPDKKIFFLIFRSSRHKRSNKRDTKQPQEGNLVP